MGKPGAWSLCLSQAFDFVLHLWPGSLQGTNADLVFPSVFSCLSTLIGFPLASHRRAPNVLPVSLRFQRRFV